MFAPTFSLSKTNPKLSTPVPVMVSPFGSEKKSHLSPLYFPFLPVTLALLKSDGIRNWLVICWGPFNRKVATTITSNESPESTNGTNSTSTTAWLSVFGLPSGEGDANGAAFVVVKNKKMGARNMVVRCILTFVDVKT